MMANTTDFPVYKVFSWFFLLAIFITAFLTKPWAFFSPVTVGFKPQFSSCATSTPDPCLAIWGGGGARSFPIGRAVEWGAT